MIVVVSYYCHRVDGNDDECGAIMDNNKVVAQQGTN